MYKNLNHLSETQINELLEKYYSGTSAKELINQYKLDIPISRLYTLFPRIKTEINCKWCENNYEIKAPSKTEKNLSYYKPELICPSCNHIADSNFCKCDNCIKEIEDKRFNEIKAKNQMIIEKYDKIKSTYNVSDMEPVDYSELDFEHKVYIGAVLRGYLSEDMSTIPMIDFSKLSPNIKYSYEIIKSLIMLNVLIVTPESDIDAFVQDDNFPETYYIDRVKYKLNLNFPENKIEFLKEIMSGVEFDEDSEEVYLLWKKIALEECLQYLILQLNLVKFTDFSPGEKTRTVIEGLLEHYSTSQIFCIIWGRVSSATRLYQEGKITKNHAANTVISTCRSYGERAILNKWSITSYSRPKNVSQSLISEFYYNQVLKIGDLGFDMPPSKL